MSNPAKIGSALAKRIAQAVCGDDHLTCLWPTCGCKSTKRKINAVALVVGEHIGDIESRITDALAITMRTENAPDHLPYKPRGYGISEMRPRESWYCERCAVEVYERRCPHCGKLKGDKK